MSITRVGTYFIRFQCKSKTCSLEGLINLKATPWMTFDDKELKIRYGPNQYLCHNSEKEYRENIKKLMDICANPYGK